MAEKVDWKILFLIGLSAGFIAAIFPRLLPYMSQAASEVSLELFTAEFYKAVTIFALMIGVTMVWLYNDTEEHTKNLFMAALALPAVLSGGVNMTGVAVGAEYGLSELSRQNAALSKKLEASSDIEYFELELGDPDTAGASREPGLGWLGISTAHAEVVTGEADKNIGGGIQINAPALEKNYAIVYATGLTEAEIDSARDELKARNISAVTKVKVKGRYYLIDTNKMTRADAVLKAMDIKEAHDIKAGIVRLK